ncbi:MAG: putative transporter permease protein [Ramlibacter sp.]|jgi:NitT/TauT family transport system permease protein|nr:putative transporter permease protein [Ramlibacter sp.]
MKQNSRTGQWLNGALPVLTLLVFLVAWEVFVHGFKVPQWMLPSPTSIAQVSVEWRAELMRHTWVTLYETVIGFGLALAIALPVAVLVAYTPALKNTIYPVLLALQSVPKVALAPLIALWLGFGILPKIVVVFLVCFFPIVVSATTGLEATTRTRVDLMRSMQASAWQVFVRLRIPEAMPHIMVGCKVAITFAVIGAVIGEFVGAEEGLGYLIMTSTAQSRTPLAFSALIILTVISIALYYLVELVEKLAIRWKN